MKRPRSNKLFDEEQNHKRDKRKEVEKEEEEEEEDSGRESEYDLLLEEGAGERVFGRDRKYEGGKKDEEGEDQKGGKNKEEEEQEEKEAWENSDPVPDLDIGDHSSFEEKESPLVESGQTNSVPKYRWTTNIETSSELSAAEESQQSHSVIHVSYWTHGL